MSSNIRLGDVIQIERGTTYKSSLLGLPGPVLLGLGTIERHGGFRNVSLRTYGGDSPTKLLVRGGELYASLKDVTQTADVLGAVARFPNEFGVGRLTQDTVRLDITADSVGSDYLYWMLRTPQYRSYCRSHATGTTTMGLPRGDFFDFRFPEPTEFTNGRVRLLELVEQKLHRNEQIVATIRHIMAAQFDRIGLDSDRAEASEATLSDFLTLNPRTAVVQGDPSTPYLGMKNLPSQGVTVSQWSTREPKGGARFQNHDTLLARITPCLENGKVGYIDFLNEGQIACGSTEFIVLRPNSGTPSSLPYFLASSRRFREFAIKHMSGTTGRQRVSASDLAKYPIGPPNRSALAVFARIEKVLLPRVKAATEQSTELDQFKDELLATLIPM